MPRALSHLFAFLIIALYAWFIGFTMGQESERKKNQEKEPHE